MNFSTINNNKNNTMTSKYSREYRALANRQLSRTNVLIAKTTKNKAITASKFECAETGDYLYTNVRVEPISPFSGKSQLISLNTSRKIEVESLPVLKEIANCSGCDTTWLASANFAENNDTFHCVVCNNELDVNEVDDYIEDEINDNDSDEDIEIYDDVNELEDSVINEEVQPAPVMEDLVIEEPKVEVPSDEVTVEIAPSDGEIVITLPEDVKEEIKEIVEETGPEPVALPEEIKEEVIQEIKEAVEEAIEEGIEIVGEEVTPVGTTFPEGEAEMELPVELTEIVDFDQLPTSVEEVLTKKLLTANLAVLLNKPEYKDKIEIIPSTTSDNIPKYYVMVDSIPVAVADFEDASDAVKSIYSNPELFAKSLFLSLEANTDESETPLKDFGIKPITAPLVNSTAAVNYNVYKAVSSMQASLKANEKEMFNVWRESFTTATLMLCKGLLKNNAEGKPRSLVTKASITDLLKSTGISNADIIVEEAFKKGIQRDYGVIVAEALSLYSKTPEARQEVRDFVADAKYQSDAVFASDQANTNQETSEVSKHQSTASTSGSDIGSILSSLKDSIRKRSI